MAWSNSDCRMFAVPVLFSGLTTASDSISQPEPTITETTATNDKQEKVKENPVAKVTITEIAVTKNGNTRAICKVEGGKENQVIIAKNSVGNTLQEGLNKAFEIEYNVMKDGNAWFAIKAKQL